MRRTITLRLCFLLVPAVLAAAKKPVTLESIAAEGRRGAAAAPVWAPGGQRFAYREGSKILIYEIAAQAKRELIDTSVLTAAATAVPPPPAFGWVNRNVAEHRVQWFPSGSALLVKAGGDLFVVRLSTGGHTALTATPEDEADPKLSPDGRLVSFRRGHDLYALDLESRKETRLTRDGSETLRNGELDWVYPEELELGTAHWWSPDSKLIAFLQFDIAREPLYPQAALLGPRAVYEPQRYPRAGDPNADVRLGVVPAGGGGTRWMDTGETRDALLARVAWWPDSRSLAVQKLNRIQNRLDLLRADAASGSSRLLFREEDPHWVNVQADPRFLKQGAEFLWLSERDGFRHIYRYAADGKQIARLTSGPWEVTGIAGVSESSGRVFFTANESSPLEEHLYSSGLDGEDRRRLSRMAGVHTISLGPTCEYYLDTASSLTEPTRRTLHASDGAGIAVFSPPDRAELEQYEILPTEILAVKASDGAVLYASLIKPAGFQPGRKYPAIVMVYGGPHAQEVRNSWSGAGFSQALAHRGYVIWRLDNRGSAGRGHAWETAIFRNLGARELEDQKEGVRHLLSLGFVDAGRVGIHGSSYGGFMTLNALLHAPEVFRAGAAVAPVTDFRNYDTIYTERYMGLPSTNAEAYDKSAPARFAANLKGALFLAHNIEDDNVLFQNSMQMADALQRAGKQFEWMIYPQKTHGVTGAARRHMYEAIAAFFDRNLK